MNDGCSYQLALIGETKQEAEEGFIATTKKIWI